MSAGRAERYAAALAELIRVETVSSAPDPAAFDRFHALLRETFPSVFSAMQVEPFDRSLLLRWAGTDETLAPLLLMSHHDVVEAGGDWTHPPFGGVIDRGKLWGRGTLDTKANLWAMLQAAEELLREGFAPRRTVYIASACNEETDGTGSNAISAALAERGVRCCMTLDEGGMIQPDPTGCTDAAFAMIGVGEKSCVDLKFIARSNGGHASTPGRDTALVRLGKFMAAAEKSKLFSVQLSPVVQEMLRRIAPYTSGGKKLLFSHPGALRAILCRTLPRISAETAALLRSTLAFTMCHGSEGSNVLPTQAWVIGNLRCSHHQGAQASIEAVRALAARFDLQTQVLDPGFESSVTDYRGAPFRLIERAVAAVSPGTVCVPYLMTGATDCCYFARVCDHCIRFSPFRIDAQQLGSIHGVDENVDLAALPPAVDFFRFILQKTQEEDLDDAGSN